MSFINIPDVSATLSPSDVTNALGYIPVNKAGDTMTGPLILNADPTTALQAATKNYVDSVAQGLNVKGAARAATTSNITLSAPQIIDGISVIAGDRVLVKNQSTGSQNGIYIVAAGAWTRSTDMNTGSEALSAFVFVTEGSVNASTGWVQTTPAPITIDSTALVFTQFSGAGTYTADNQGVILTGSQFSLQIANSTLSQSGSGVRVATGGITNNEINVSAGIVYSKLNLSNSIVNADVNAAAGIVYSKLNLSNSIVNADISTSAAIARSKIATGIASQVVVNDGSGNLSSVAVIPVSNGGTGSSVQNFVDLTTAQSILGGKTLSPTILTDAANITTNVALGNLFTVTLTDNRNLSAPTNPVDGQKVTWVFIQDAVGGRTLTFDPVFNFGTFPTLILSGAPNKRDFMGAVYNSLNSSWSVVAYSVGF